MTQLTINGIKLSVNDGVTLLEAAREAGIKIPALCSLCRGKEGEVSSCSCQPFSSCQICLVRANGRIVPSCSTIVQEGMIVESETEEIRELRRTALELLLSDHQGDCFAPCHLACPFHLNIPKILLYIKKGDFKSAIRVIWEQIPLPSLWERLCTRPCEKVCRHALTSGSITICQLIRFTADTILGDDEPVVMPHVPPTKKNVAIIGAGPAGLSAAWYLTQKGHQVTLFEKDAISCGGRLKKYSEDILPPEVVEIEINHLLGQEVPNAIDFRLNSPVLWSDKEQSQELLDNFDAILLAFGRAGLSELISRGLQGLSLQSQKDNNDNNNDNSNRDCNKDNNIEHKGAQPEEGAREGIATDSVTGQTAVLKIFAAGTAVHYGISEGASMSEGRNVAQWIDRFLTQKESQAEAQAGDRALNQLLAVSSSSSFRVQRRKVDESVCLEYERYSLSMARKEPLDVGLDDFSKEEAQEQAARCYFCGCPNQKTCRLVQAAEELNVCADRFSCLTDSAKTPFRLMQSEEWIYEPGKCIRCGHCVQLAQAKGEKYGLAFVGREFELQVTVPLGHSLTDGLHQWTDSDLSVCPVGALFRRKVEGDF